ncbi:transposase family protein [Edaphobacter sp. 12200R-103]|uniref:transposase family protein n=1 Tax=Edaphobacter sp. 12200R-103 TaxID=2703788 RepID=UPI00138CEC4E|nr:transposase family protein [Edaphobacter sp. 12200R-103]QHS51720.1 transposase family protein [Edaphobacter sp. 12200R-103]
MTANGKFQRGKTVRLREQAIAALLTNPSMRDAARESGVGYSTLIRWSNEPEFAAALKAARNELLDSAIQRLKTAAFNAVGTLIEVAASPASSDMARVSSSKALIELALRVGTIEQLADRIEELERKTTDENNGGFEGSAQTLTETPSERWQ